MRATKVLAKFDRTVVQWRERLGAISEDDFGRAPANGGWSTGHMWPA